jgi:hypothetical protein
MGDTILRRVRHASVDRRVLRRVATRRGAVRRGRRRELPMSRWLMGVLLSWVTTYIDTKCNVLNLAPK